MEKIKVNYKKFALVSFIITTTVIIVSIVLNVRNANLLPLLYLVNIFAFIYLFVLENHTDQGFYIGEKGIGFCKKGNIRTVEWNNVVVKQNISGLWVVLGSESKIHIDSSRIDSVAYLTSKYCPKDHALYKAIKEFSISKKIPF